MHIFDKEKLVSNHQLCAFLYDLQSGNSTKAAINIKLTLVVSLNQNHKLTECMH